MRGPLKSTVLVAFVVMLLLPTTARANKWLAWLEELSGPGQFEGPIRAGIEVACLGSPLSKTETLALTAYTGAQISRELTSAVDAFNGVVSAVKAMSGPNEDAKLAFLMDTIESLQARTELSQIEGVVTGAVARIGAQGHPQLREIELGLRQLLLTLDPGPARAGGPHSRGVLDQQFWPAFEVNQRKFRRCRVDRSNNIVGIQLEVAWLNDDDHRGRYDGFTRATTIGVVAYVPIGRLNMDWSGTVPPWGRFLEVGAGVGALGLNGSTLRDSDLWRGTLPVRARVLLSEAVYFFKDCVRGRKCDGVNVELEPSAPSSRWRRFFQAFQYHYGADYVIGTVDNQLYSDLGPMPPDSEGEWIRSHGVTFDLGVFMFRSAAGR